MEIYCEKAWHGDNEYHKAGYLYTEGDIIYVPADAHCDVLRKLDNRDNYIVIYDIEN